MESKTASTAPMNSAVVKSHSLSRVICISEESFNVVMCVSSSVRPSQAAGPDPGNGRRSWAALMLGQDRGRGR